MKIWYIVWLLVVLIPILLLCILIIPQTNTRNADVVISSDYSTITYRGNVYVPIQPEQLPFDITDIKTTIANDMIKATVEDNNYFLDKYFLTNYIAIKEFNGETFIYLHTDYDVNESDYYCSQTYKNKNEE